MNRIYIPIAVRQAVVERAKNCCEYCQSPALYSPEIFEIEHIQPLSAQGKTELSNLALACPACNRYKGNLQAAPDPETHTLVSIFNPRIHLWAEHFIWSKDFASINGLTPTGRATATLLQMNRPATQRFRIALYAVGLHPIQF
jgi:5-methylcytosine-specific restriction endonuclease McrA